MPVRSAMSTTRRRWAIRMSRRAELTNSSSGLSPVRRAIRASILGAGFLLESCTIQDRSGDMRTIEAVINEKGHLRLLEPIERGTRRRAIVVVLDDVGVSSDETATLSEKALDGWNRPEEDSPWSHLQPAK